MAHVPKHAVLDRNHFLKMYYCVNKNVMNTVYSDDVAGCSNV